MTAGTALWMTVVAVLVLGSLHLVGGIVVDEAFVERRASRLIDRELGPHDVSVGDVSVRPLLTGIRITSLRVLPRPDGRKADDPPPTDDPGLRLHASELEIDGIDLLSALGGSLAAREVRAADVTVVRHAGSTGWSQVVAGLELELHDFGPGGATEPPLLVSVLGALAEARAKLYLIRGPDGRRSIELREVLVSPATAAARTERATLWMTRNEVSDSDPWPGGDRVATDTTRISATGMRARGLALDTADGTIAVSGRSLVVDSLAALVVDAVPPGPPGPRAPDTVRVSTRSHLQGTAPVRLDVDFPGSGEDFSFTAEGSVSDLPLTSLDPMFEPVAGVRIRGGWLGDLTFRLAVAGGRARGTVRPVFDDLDLSLEDPSSGGRGIAEHVRGFVMNLRLNSDNLPAEGDGFRRGTIDRRVSSGETFLQALWYSLREGLRDVTGV